MAVEQQTLDQAAEQNASQGGGQKGGSYGETWSKLAAVVVQSPADPTAYKGVTVGPELAIEWEARETTQVELSDSTLRDMSPFVIQIEPPAVFADLTAPAEGNLGVPALDIYGTANGGLATYQAARSSLAASSEIAGMMGKGISAVEDVEEFLVKKAGILPSAGGGLVPLSALSADIPVGTPPYESWLAAADTQRQLLAILEAPPLVLLVNPTSLRVSLTKIQQFQDRTRYGYLLHAWGEDQMKVSITAVCGAFISGGRGVHAASKRDSLAWQNMMNLVHFYRNNGYIHDTVGKSNAHLHVGALSIRYDNWIYYGNMESLNFSFTEDKNLGGVGFSLEFTANRHLDVSQQFFNVLPLRAPIPSLSDPRYGSGGGGSRRPGHWQWNMGEGRIESDGQVESDNRGASATDFFGSTVPSSWTGGSAGGSKDGTGRDAPGGVPEQPLGDDAWTASSDAADAARGGGGGLAADRPVGQADPDFCSPFGMGPDKKTMSSPTTTFGM